MVIKVNWFHGWNGKRFKDVILFWYDVIKNNIKWNKWEDQWHSFWLITRVAVLQFWDWVQIASWSIFSLVYLLYCISLLYIHSYIYYFILTHLLFAGNKQYSSIIWLIRVGIITKAHTLNTCHSNFPHHVIWINDWLICVWQDVNFIMSTAYHINALPFMWINGHSLPCHINK